MPSIKRKEVIYYVEENIGNFHEARLTNLGKLKLRSVLKRKNPYLFRAKDILVAHDLVKAILDAHLSSQEETIFGEFLEGLAIFVCFKVHNGIKSSSEGIDLEFDKDGIRYLVSIKSGPNWGNASQVNKLKDSFRRAIKTLRTNNSRINVIAVNGCCYGRDNKPQKEDYLKLCGQRFWEFISGDSFLYINIIEPLGHKAKEKNEAFQKAYSQLLNKFVAEFTDDFCNSGIIDWDKLVKFNSSTELLPKTFIKKKVLSKT